MLIVTIHEYYEGDSPNGDTLPAGLVGWNSAVEIIGCDDADITTSWTSRTNSNAFGSVNSAMIVDPRKIDEEMWSGGAAIPNTPNFTNISFRVTIDSPGCDSVELGVDYTIVAGTQGMGPPAQYTNYAESFDITVAGIGGTILSGSTSATIVPTPP